MIVKSILAGMYEENCYLLIDKSTRDCGIIDPGGNAERIAKAILSENLNPKYVLLTHGHLDHVGAVEDICKKFNIPFYISKEDAEFAKKDSMVFGEIPDCNNYLKENDTIKLGTHTIKVIETPGHTPGGLCFLVEDKLLTGDTLFQGSVGRSDFPGGNGALLIKMIKDKLMTLDDNIEVYPGHGPMSTIGFERKRNPYLQDFEWDF